MTQIHSYRHNFPNIYSLTVIKHVNLYIKERVGIALLVIDLTLEEKFLDIENACSVS